MYSEGGLQIMAGIGTCMREKVWRERERAVFFFRFIHQLREGSKEIEIWAVYGLI
jgi:hypothetical protein